MKYFKTIKLKDSRECVLRNAVREDGQAVLENFIQTHTETDFLLSYPDEIKYTLEEEADYMQEKADSENEIEVIAVVGGKVVGSAGICAVGKSYKIRSRATFGISVIKEFWGLGIGKAMIEACVECAKEAGYIQLELDVNAANERALGLYKKCGFVEYGRNPYGFNSRENGWQPMVLMRKELKALPHNNEN